ncbi:ABC transporter ATP-binding protein [Frankia sp. CNm7]|uniref:ABC transporter ATP-binding protein n=1 Tax=Frankia nepalensis TaxID=1836974 RepID=A0A937RIC1_9ACTN|nr:ABC transporter ATP-binding protein [Frankia nepalensis]MBL7515012.1 ABC transporter ATP-binding protein [Frankia nepalensis]MBL7523566.1 ABC transporter ATP-binding protein [Frankia nepalensis]MBL7626903.1 ABC transporter ATP-binding protein [Frankia nepalensis]
MSAGALPTGGASARGGTGATGPTVIRAQGVSKKFVSYHKRATSLKEMIVRRGGLSGEDFWALRDVNVEISRGQTVGLAGANGSGKSTLLKVLAGILRPTSGRVEVNGRIASLLELGAGFNGELSGRDNVYLNASLLGLTKRETDRLFDSIVDFAELRHKIDDEVKHYSSGQYVRLGFAVAVHVDPDILLVDEVLAVGDEAFQRKCLAKIDEFRSQGRTILFVTHSLDLIENMCDRVVVLESGRVIHDGAPAIGTKLLRQRLGSSPTEGSGAFSQATVRPETVTYSSTPGGPTEISYDPGDPLTITVGIEASAGCPPRVGVRCVAVGQHEIPIWVMETPAGGIPITPGFSFLDFTIDRLPALLGAFAVRVEVVDPTTGELITSRRFHDLFGISGSHAEGLVHVSYEARPRA